MNRTYRSVWNEALGAWVATSELGGGRRKGAQRAAVSVALVLLAMGAAQAQVKIGDNPNTINPGSMVEVESTKGESAVGLSFRRTSDNNAWSLTGGVATSRAGVGATVGAEWVFN